jgi:hypothetical protein
MTRASVLDPNKYEDDEDGLPREIVGPWARDKYARLAKYVDISRAVRSRWVGKGNAGASFIDLFCGPGRARIKDTREVLHGSSLVAWLESDRTTTGFTQVHVADADDRLVAAASTRLRRAGAPVTLRQDQLKKTVDLVIPKLIHVSVQDLNRNLLRYVSKPKSPLDTFAPNWRQHVDTERSISHIRGKLFEHWRSWLQTIGMSTAEAAELVVGSNKQPLYWLAFAARHKLALQFWEKIRHLEPKRQNDIL